MLTRLTIASATAAVMLTGCAQPQPDVAESAAAFSQGPSQIDVSHVVTLTDDGSPVVVTVDGKEAGVLNDGNKTELHVPAGKHQVGGYVPTLLGRVTIQSVDVTTADNQVTQVTYSVAKEKAAFSQNS